MASSPPIYRPKPQRPFNQNAVPEQPPSPLLAPIAIDDTPSRTHSVLNLTSSTLLGIYSSTGYDNDREGSSTPWGTGSETPARSSAYFPTRRQGQLSLPQPQQTWAAFAFGLSTRAVLLGVLGMLYGVLVRHLHDEQQLVPFGVESIINPRDDWAYLLYWGLAGVALGSLLPWVDTLWAGRDGNTSKRESEGIAKTQGPGTSKSTGIFGADWTPAIRSVGAFVGIAFAIRRLPWASTLQASLTLALVNPVLWYLVDRSKPGFILSAAVGATGTAFLLASHQDMVPSPASPSRNVTSYGSHFSGGGYTNRETIEGAIWTLSVLFCSCVCFGNIGRRLTLSGWGDRAPSCKVSSGKQGSGNGGVSSSRS